MAVSYLTEELGRALVGEQVTVVSREILRAISDIDEKWEAWKLSCLGAIHLMKEHFDFEVGHYIP